MFATGDNTSSHINFSYILFIITFLLFPLVALLARSEVRSPRIKRLLYSTSAFFLLYDLLFALGWSFTGDYLDYTIFSFEYLLLCLIVASISRPAKPYVLVLRVLGIVTISLGAVVGLIGIIFFIPVSQDYETDKIIQFQSNGRDYETRRYSFGFATLEDITYTFDTYRKHRFLPFEQRIDETIFFGSRTKLNVEEVSVSIYINRYGEKNLVFISSGTSYLKPLK